MQELKGRWQQDYLDLKLDNLIILVGMNDCFATKDEDFEEDYRWILEETLKHGSPEIILLEETCSGV